MGRNKVRLVNKNKYEVILLLTKIFQNLVFEIIYPLAVGGHIKKKKKTIFILIRTFVS